MSIGSTSSVTQIRSISEGLATKAMGTVTASDRTLHLNFIAKVPSMPALPTWTKDSCEVTKRENIYYQSLLNALLQGEQEMEDYLKARKDLLKDFIDQTTNKKIRSAVWAGLGVLVSGLLTGVTEVQIIKINQHLHETEAEVRQLKAALRDTETKELRLAKTTLAVVKQLQYQVERQFQKEECLTTLANYIAERKIDTLRFKQELDEILWTALEGSNYLPLNPKILSPPTLKTLTGSHDMFTQLAYAKDPNLLYSLARITLVDLTPDLTLAHFILTFPRIVKDAAWPLYEINQVGLRQGKTCSFFLTPDYVFEKDDSWQPIDLKRCDAHLNLHVCGKDAFNNISSCLQSTSMNCTQYSEECNEKVIELKDGILFRSKEQILAKDWQGKLEVIKKTTRDVAFVSWSTHEVVQIGSATISSPIRQMNSTPITLTNYTGYALTPPPTNMTIKDVTSSLNTLCVSLNDTLDNILTPERFRPAFWYNFANIIATAFNTSIILASIAWIIYTKARVWTTESYRRYKAQKDPKFTTLPRRSSTLSNHTI